MRFSVKICLVFLSAFALTASCVKSVDDTEDNGDTLQALPIEFNMGEKHQSKATAITGYSLPINSKFRIYAFELPEYNGQAGSYLYNSKLYYSFSISGFVTATYTSSETVDIGTAKYWPNARNSRLKFVSVYPSATNSYVTNISTTTGANPSVYVDYVCDADLNNHQNIIYSVTDDLNRVPVNLVMHHATTRVSFSARVLSSPKESKFVKISSIKFSGISRPNVVQKKSRLRIKGDGVEWDNSVFPYDVGTYELVRGNGLVDVELRTYRETPDTEGADYYRSLMPAGHTMMMIPQDISDMLVEVTVEITNPDSYPVATTYERNFFIPSDSSEWAPGTHVHYKLTVARDVVYVGAEVSLWGNLNTSGNISTGKETVEFD